jgi:hypothetical protein
MVIAGVASRFAWRTSAVTPTIRFFTPRSGPALLQHRIDSSTWTTSMVRPTALPPLK